MPHYIKLKNGKWKLLEFEESEAFHKSGEIPERLREGVLIERDEDGNESYVMKLATFDPGEIPDEMDEDEWD